MLLMKFCENRCNWCTMKAKIAITIRSFDSIQILLKEIDDIGSVVYVNDTEKRLDESELCKVIQDVDAVIAGTEPFTRKVFESAPNLRVISRVGVGLDNIDMDAAYEHNVTIVNTPITPSLSVAEHTLSLLLTVIKRIAIYNKNIRKNDFSINSGLLLSGRSVGIIGLGRVGLKVAGMLEMLACRIYYFDPFLEKQPSEKWTRMNSLKELLKSADIVTLHVPSQPKGTPLLDKEAFESCKYGTVLINTARGSLIDEDALAFAIEEGIVWGAGLDVFSNEPYTGKLLDYPQVVVTPHVASNTIESRNQMEIEAINNFINELRDEK